LINMTRMLLSPGTTFPIAVVSSAMNTGARPTCATPAIQQFLWHLAMLMALDWQHVVLWLPAQRFASRNQLYERLRLLLHTSIHRHTPIYSSCKCSYLQQLQMLVLPRYPSNRRLRCLRFRFPQRIQQQQGFTLSPNELLRFVRSRIHLPHFKHLWQKPWARQRQKSVVGIASR